MKQKYYEKTRPSATLSTTNPTYDRGLNSDAAMERRRLTTQRPRDASV
jgi:hypothetical protein